jgi:hypothetical protein
VEGLALLPGGRLAVLVGLLVLLVEVAAEVDREVQFRVDALAGVLLEEVEREVVALALVRDGDVLPVVADLLAVNTEYLLTVDAGLPERLQYRVVFSERWRRVVRWTDPYWPWAGRSCCTRSSSTSVTSLRRSFALRWTSERSV